jgi:hypothetical protein
LETQLLLGIVLLLVGAGLGANISSGASLTVFYDSLDKTGPNGNKDHGRILRNRSLSHVLDYAQTLAGLFALLAAFVLYRLSILNDEMGWNGAVLAERIKTDQARTLNREGRYQELLDLAARSNNAGALLSSEG